MDRPAIGRRLMQTARQAASQGLCAAAPAVSLPSSRRFSVLNRPPPNYPGHVPLTRLERASLAVGSGVMSLLNPYRHGGFLTTRHSQAFLLLLLVDGARRWATDSPL